MQNSNRQWWENIKEKFIFSSCLFYVTIIVIDIRLLYRIISQLSMLTQADKHTNRKKKKTTTKNSSSINKGQTRLENLLLTGIIQWQFFFFFSSIETELFVDIWCDWFGNSICSFSMKNFLQSISLLEFQSIEIPWRCYSITHEILRPRMFSVLFLFREYIHGRIAYLKIDIFSCIMMRMKR